LKKRILAFVLNYFYCEGLKKNVFSKQVSSQRDAQKFLESV